MKAQIALTHTGEDRIGWMRAEIWSGKHQMLLEQGILAGLVDSGEAFTMQFLNEIYGEIK
jgi:hypothetical protein